ncbi:NADPH-dependent FMN reductase [Thalassomonas haliotis]|uniref:NAD(P)H-dependent oxidoreductase n=1 Tax=Thalassomonas haliotis TaxID=485448 RepID=A0ABY7VK10_9GAMM|nr:NAD(P)H-dependent oxidoreductase [Thalassomonas haliotis]WDE14072.1 NAD(P)H-dependent oxidoreductase [Thalassomonas haliotis]
MKKILAFSGSNHSQSIHQHLIDFAASKVANNAVSVIDLKQFPLPVYSQDIEARGLPDAAKDLRQLMAEYDALMIASPEHNGSMPAFLKNIIDWLSRVAEPGQPFFGDISKPVLLLSTSPGQSGGATNLKHMAELMPWWGGEVKGCYSLGNYHEKCIDGVFNQSTDQALTETVHSFETTLR